jgi:hypothetical protein
MCFMPKILKLLKMNGLTKQPARLAAYPKRQNANMTFWRFDKSNLNITVRQSRQLGVTQRVSIPAPMSLLSGGREPLFRF